MKFPNSLNPNSLNPNSRRMMARCHRGQLVRGFGNSDFGNYFPNLVSLRAPRRVVNHPSRRCGRTSAGGWACRCNLGNSRRGRSSQRCAAGRRIGGCRARWNCLPSRGREWRDGWAVVGAASRDAGSPHREGRVARAEKAGWGRGAAARAGRFAGAHWPAIAAAEIQSE